MASAQESPTQQKGIDIKDALSILTERAKSGGDDVTSSDRKSLPDEVRSMGQTIDVANELDFTRLKCGCDNDGCDRMSDDKAIGFGLESDKNHDNMKRERKERGLKIEAKLATLEVSDLLGAIFGAQEERVATYNAFEEGLASILNTGNITKYPALCAKVTASFSVLSDTINTAKNILATKYKRTDICIVVEQLQKYESEKLNFTAALHLERLRLNNLLLGGSSVEADDRTKDLLKEGIRSLTAKNSNAIVLINESIEELRCIAVDE